MFDLNNFDLDFSDDFSTNIFSKAESSNKKSEESVKLNTPRSGPTEVRNVDNVKPNREFNPKSSFSSTQACVSLSASQSKVVKENNLKRFCNEDEKPAKKRFSHEGLVSRRFPGPAGLLPDKPFKEITDMKLPSETSKNQTNPDDDEKGMVYSQNSGSLFLDSTYQQLISDFSLNESNNPLNKYTIGWVKKTALSKGLQGRKIPFLGLMVYSVNQGLPDPVLVLRDPTGEIHASLHREVWTDMGGKFRAGVALALRQVGVLITGVIRRQIYLNITMNNILSIYTPSENESGVDVTSINKASRSELIKSFEQWLAQPSKAGPPKPVQSPPVFTTVDDVRSRERVNNWKNNGGQKRKTEEVLENLGIVLSDEDFTEEMNVPVSGGGVCSQGLTLDESLMVEEVLSGVNLDEFEM